MPCPAHYRGRWFEPPACSCEKRTIHRSICPIHAEKGPSIATVVAAVRTSASSHERSPVGTALEVMTVFLAGSPIELGHTDSPIGACPCGRSSSKSKCLSIQGCEAFYSTPRPSTPLSPARQFHRRGGGSGGGHILPVAGRPGTIPETPNSSEGFSMIHDAQHRPMQSIPAPRNTSIQGHRALAGEPAAAGSCSGKKLSLQIDLPRSAKSVGATWITRE